MTRASESTPSAQQRLRRIEGRHNALVKDLRLAFSRAERTEDGSCAIEGLRIVEEATRSGLRFRAVFFKESAQNLAERLLPRSAPTSIRCCFPTNFSTPPFPARPR